MNIRVTKQTPSGSLPPILSHPCFQARDTAVLIDGCLFEDCYAGKEAGGVFQDAGRMSVVGSLFYNNTAGSNNTDGGERAKIDGRSGPGESRRVPDLKKRNIAPIYSHESTFQC